MTLGARFVSIPMVLLDQIMAIDLFAAVSTFPAPLQLELKDLQEVLPDQFPLPGKFPLPVMPQLVVHQAPQENQALQEHQGPLDQLPPLEERQGYTAPLNIAVSNCNFPMLFLEKGTCSSL